MNSFAGWLDALSVMYLYKSPSCFTTWLVVTLSMPTNTTRPLPTSFAIAIDATERGTFSSWNCEYSASRDTTESPEDSIMSRSA